MADPAAEDDLVHNAERVIKEYEDNHMKRHGRPSAAFREFINAIRAAVEGEISGEQNEPPEET